MALRDWLAANPQTLATQKVPAKKSRPSNKNLSKQTHSSKTATTTASKQKPNFSNFSRDLLKKNKPKPKAKEQEKQQLKNRTPQTLATLATLAVATPTDLKNRARVKLEKAAQGTGVQIDALMAFYSQDMPDIANMPQATLVQMVQHFKLMPQCKQLTHQEQATPPTATKVIKGKTASPLDDLPLLHEEKLFIDSRAKALHLTATNRQAVIKEYARQWQAGAATTEAEHRKDNAGRFAANSWLRKLSQDEAKALER